MLKFHSLSPAQGVPAITPHELKVELQSEAPPVLLDVREESELHISRLPGAHHIPLGDLPRRYAEIDAGANVVVVCRSGARSAEAAKLLLRKGHASVRNLAGGINAWASDVDPSLPVY